MHYALSQRCVYYRMPVPARRPLQNWSPWNHFTIHATEDVIMGNARALVSTGLARLGYTLVQLDAGSLVARDARGRLVNSCSP